MDLRDLKEQLYDLDENIELHRGTITSIFKNICDEHIHRLNISEQYKFSYRYTEGYFRCDVSMKWMKLVNTMKSRTIKPILDELTRFLNE